MTRIRTIKPGFWTSQSLARVSRDARLVFAGLWNEADDEGRLADSPKALAGALFPFDDDIDKFWMDKRLQELVKIGAIVRYGVDGSMYIAIPNFLRHQTINKPRPSTLPPPPKDGSVPDDSRSPPVVVPESSRRTTTGNGMEWNGMEEEGNGSAAVAARPEPTPPEMAVNRGRMNPNAPPPLPGRIITRHGGSKAFMENPATWPSTPEELLERHAADFVFPMLDGRTPRPSLLEVVAGKWASYVTKRERDGGHAMAVKALKTWVADVAARHDLSWRKEGNTAQAPPPQTDAERIAAHEAKIAAFQAAKREGRA